MSSQALPKVLTPEQWRKAVAKGTQPKRGEMNTLEADYAAQLELEKRAGAITEYWFEPFNLRLAKDTFYRADFLVMLADGTLEIRETKGFMREDALIKLKIVAEKYPFRVLVVYRRLKKEGGGWRYEEI